MLANMRRRETPLKERLVPFRFDRRLKIRLLGRWRKGGVLEWEFAGKALTAMPLPAAQFTVLGILVEAARKAKHWGESFLDASTLANELENRAGLGGGDEQDLYRAVYR